MCQGKGCRVVGCNSISILVYMWVWVAGIASGVSKEARGWVGRRNVESRNKNGAGRVEVVGGVGQGWVESEDCKEATGSDGKGSICTRQGRVEQ